MDDLCSTCLSKHRTLVPLSTTEVISSLTEMIPFAGSPVLVCWECNSRLQNMWAFKSQAIKAQELLKLYQENKKPLKALRSLSRLSQSNTKTNYDENFVYCMKQETVEWDEEFLDDFQSDIKYDTQVIEHIPKAEKIDVDIQESHQSETLYVTVEPLTESKVRDGEDSDEWPLSQVTKEQVCESDSNIKTEPKNYEIEQNDRKLSKDEENFDIKRMSFEEMYRLRDEDRKNVRYMSCPFKCRSCITGYFTEEKYKAHVLLRHSRHNGPHACDICLARHQRADQLSRHREAHLRSYHCRGCPFTSHKLSLMLVHQSEHKVERFSCEFCGFSALKKGRLRYHVKKMHEKPPRCEMCLRDFSSEDSLKKHIIGKHGNGKKREKCTLCGGMYRYLAAHARTHAPPAPDAFCVECGVSFKSKNTLRKHLLEHSKHRQQNDAEALKWFECNDCDFRFTNKTCLERHISSQHTKQYPFNCAICHKGFSRRDRLKIHVFERHEGGQRPRENVCSYCGKAFKAKQVLINHIRIHTGERPFRCAHCPWSFAQHTALRTHERALHPGADTGNTAGAGSSGNTEDGGKGGKNEP